MKLSKLIEKTSIKCIVGNDDIDIKTLHFDSRKVEIGTLFFATRGVSTNGHQFIAQAIGKGAVAVVCEELPEEKKDEVCYLQVENSAETLGLLASAWYGNPSTKLKLVGVTGTNGKTTIATLLYQLTLQMGYAAGLISTVANFVNGEKTVATHTTPDAIALNRLLAKMVNVGCEYAFMEVSSHAIEQNRIAGLDFDGGIFTNLTRDHIDYHLTFDNYLKAKKRFFDTLKPTAFAISNKDDRNGEVMLQNSKAHRYLYSLYHMADFSTKIIEHSFEGMLIEINNIELSVQFVGNFNAYNLTAVFGTAVQMGFDKREVLRIMSSLQSVAGRFETLRSPKGFSAIVDYAHTPDALRNVVSTINEVLSATERGRLITVVGCGGNRDKGKRPIMAREAVGGSWKAVLTSDNPRDEDPQGILDDMVAGLDEQQKQECLVIVDRREAIKIACTLAQKDDVVLVAGKGHEDYQIVKGVKYHFDDKEEIANYL